MTHDELTWCWDCHDTFPKGEEKYVRNRGVCRARICKKCHAARKDLAKLIHQTPTESACYEILWDAVMDRVVTPGYALQIAEDYHIRSFTNEIAEQLQDRIDG